MNVQQTNHLKELKAYKRAEIKKGETTGFEIEVRADAFCYYDRKLNFGMHDGDFTVSVATSSVNVLREFEIRVRDGKITF